MKSKILLLTTMFASASFAFAQTSTDPQTVTYQGVTFELLNGKDDVTFDNEGTEITSTLSDVIQASGSSLVINTNKKKTINNQRRKINVKAIAVNSQEMKAGQILNWTDTPLAPEVAKDVDYTTYLANFGKEPRENKGLYEVKTELDEYKRYKDICEAAMENARKVGIYIKNGKSAVVNEDVDGFPIHDDMFYFEKFVKVNNEYTFTYTPITSTQGSVQVQTEMINCQDTYTPTEIASNVIYNVKTNGKVGVASGVFNNARIEEAVKRGERNFDFLKTLILGEVNVDVPVNKLAYFAKNTTATGTNVVVNTTAEKYLIKDNGEEIYVNKPFTAEEAIYERSLTKGQFGTIVIPFKISSPGRYLTKPSELTNYDEASNTLTFTTTGLIAPNTPYMFKVKTSTTTLRGDANTPVEETYEAESDVFEGAQFVGTFEQHFEDNMYVINKEGKIGITSKALMPGRCYLLRNAYEQSSKLANATIEIIDEDGSTETIQLGSEATSIEGMSSSDVVSVKYISINGQTSDKPFNGLNIVQKIFSDDTIETSKVVF